MSMASAVRMSAYAYILEEPEQMTHINTDGVFVQVWGVREKYKLDYVRVMIDFFTQRLNDGFGQLPSFTELIPGKKMLAIYKNQFQRAEIMQLDSSDTRKVIVNFIDFGIVTSVNVSDIRICDGDNIFDSVMNTGLAEDFILHGTIARRQWTNQEVESVSSILKRTDIECTVIGNVDVKKIIQVNIPVKGQSNLSRIALSTYLVRSGLADQISDAIFTDLLRSNSGRTNISAENPLPSSGTITNQSNNLSIIPINRNNTSQISLPPTYQQINVPRPVQNAQSVAIVQSYIYFTLPVDSMHDVVISHVEDGMNAFDVQLKKSKYIDLPNLTAKIKNIRPEPITGKIEPRALCLGRCHQDSNLRRAVVCSVLADGASLHFVDFGCLETVPFDKIYKIPPELVQESPMALRFALTDVTNALNTPEARSMFTNTALRENLIFKLKVVKPLVPTQQLCELFIVADGGTINVRSKILDRMVLLKSVEYKKLTLQKNNVADVTISYSDSPQRFFAHLKQNQTTLEVIQKSIENLCINSENESGFLNMDIYKNRPVLAPFKDDKYCRGLIIEEDSDCDGYVNVFHVDYGNYDTLHYKKLRFINPEMVSTYPCQVIKCRLDIDPSLIANPEVTSAFIKLTDGENFKMSVKNILFNNILLVDLVDQRGLNVANHLFETFGAKSSAADIASPKPLLQNPAIGNWRVENSLSTQNNDFSYHNEKSRLDSSGADNYVQSRNTENINEDLWNSPIYEISDSDGEESQWHDEFSGDHGNDRYAYSQDRNEWNYNNNTWETSYNNQDDNSIGSERRFNDRFADRRIKTWDNVFGVGSSNDDTSDNEYPRWGNRSEDKFPRRGRRSQRGRYFRKGGRFNTVQNKPYRFSPPNVFSSRSRCKHESVFFFLN